MRPTISLFSLLCFFVWSACKQVTPAETSTPPASTTTANGKEFIIDVAHSELKWQAFKAVGSHNGIVPIREGKVMVDGNAITGGSVTLDMNNLQVTDLEGDDKLSLEKHLKGLKPGKEDDFFNTVKYPTATFAIKGSTPISGDSDANQLVHGELTMRDITKPVNIKAKLDTGAGNAIKITSAPFTIDRTEWGIKFRSKKFFNNLKDDFVYDEIKIELTIGAIE